MKIVAYKLKESCGNEAAIQSVTVVKGRNPPDHHQPPTDLNKCKTYVQSTRNIDFVSVK